MIASLGRGPATDLLASLLSGASLPSMPTLCSIALTSGSAQPTSIPAELTVAGYARQTGTWSGSHGLWSNVEDQGWSLPVDTVVGGISILTTRYSTLVNPLAWITLDQLVTAQVGIDYLIPAGSIKIQGYTSL